jgi:hypothetical protein
MRTLEKISEEISSRRMARTGGRLVSVFAPAWQERVLDGRPQIPYLHVTEIRRREWHFRRGES